MECKIEYVDKNKKTIKCDYCNKISNKPESYIKSSNLHFCNRICVNEYQRKNSGWNPKWNKDVIKEEVLRIYNKLNKVPTLNDLELEGLYHILIYRYFNGIGDLLNYCGLPAYREPDSKFEKPLNNLITIYVDSREQKPYVYNFAIKKTLNVGDYACDICPNIRIERKSKNDLVSTIFSGRDRFKRELDRAREDKLFVIILCELTIQDIRNRNYYQWEIAHPNSIIHFIKEIGNEYKDVCQFVFGINRKKCRLLLPFLFSWGEIICSSYFDIQEIVNKIPEDYLKKYIEIVKEGFL
jgi:hypothetical protein